MIAVFRLFLLILIGPGVPHAAESLRFASMELESREVVIREFSPLLKWMEKGLGRPIHIAYHENYDDILDAFAKRQIDLAYLGPLPYVLLRDRYPAAEPMIRFNEADGGAGYRCVLAAFRGDAIRLAGLRNRTIGLTQPLSTCGPLSVDALLRKQAGFGLEQTRQRLLGNHQNVAQAIVGGEVAAGGLKESIAKKYAGLGLEVLASTASLPGFALIVNRATLNDAQVASLRRHLLAAPPSVYRLWGAPLRHGMQSAADADYDGVRALADKSRPVGAGSP
jgi:phosphonate transport system substrate-binding protein